MSRLLRLLPVLAVLALGACDPQADPVLPAAQIEQSAASRAIVDGREGGNPFFHFQPPFIAGPYYRVTGEFAVDLYPFLSAVLCEVVAGECVGDPIATTSANQPGLERLKVNRSRRVFEGKLDLRGTDLDPSREYRVVVLAQHVQLGHADVSASSPGRSTGGVSIRRRGVLPVAFSLTEGVLEQAGAALVSESGGTVLSSDRLIELTVPMGAVEEPLILSIAESTAVDPVVSLPGAGAPVGETYALEPTGTSFGVPITVRAPLPAGEVGSDLDVVHYSPTISLAPDFVETRVVDGMLEFELESFSWWWTVRKNEVRVFNARWGIPTVRWYLDESGIPNGSSLTNSLVGDAFDRWESRQGSLTFARAASEAQAQIVIRRKARSIPQEFACAIGFGARAGFACMPNPIQSEYGSTDRAEVWLYTPYTETLGTVGLRNLLIHEIGHTLGLAHSAGDATPDYIMERTLDDVYSAQIQRPDEASVQYHYGPPQDTWVEVFAEDFSGYQSGEVPDDLFDVRGEAENAQVLIGSLGGLSKAMLLIGSPPAQPAPVGVPQAYLFLNSLPPGGSQMAFEYDVAITTQAFGQSVVYLGGAAVIASHVWDTQSGSASVYFRSGQCPPSGPCIPPTLGQIEVGSARTFRVRLEVDLRQGVVRGMVDRDGDGFDDEPEVSAPTYGTRLTGVVRFQGQPRGLVNAFDNLVLRVR